MKKSELKQLIREVKNSLNESIVGHSKEDVKALFLSPSLDRKYEKLKDEMKQIELIKKNASKDIDNLFKELQKISSKFKIKVVLEEPHGPGKFVINFIYRTKRSPYDEPLYEELLNLIKTINKTSSLGVIRAGGHGFEGNNVDYFSHIPGYVIHIG